MSALASTGRPTAALLDIDGTLLDSNDAHAFAWERAMREHGFGVSFERIRALIGKGGDKVLPELTGVDAESTLGQLIGETRKAIFARDYLPSLAPCPGARVLVERMLKAGLKLIVATSASDEEVKALLERANVDDLIEITTTKDDADGHSKPEPDIVQAALKKGRVDASKAIMLGDTPYDIEAATKAGVKTVALRSGGWTTTDLHGAAAIYDHAAALAEAFEQSPFMMGARST